MTTPNQLPDPVHDTKKYHDTYYASGGADYSHLGKDKAEVMNELFSGDVPAVPAGAAHIGVQSAVSMHDVTDDLFMYPSPMSRGPYDEERAVPTLPSWSNKDEIAAGVAASILAAPHEERVRRAADVFARRIQEGNAPEPQPVKRIKKGVIGDPLLAPRRKR